MKSVSALVVLIGLAVPAVSQAASPENGRAVYEKWCLPCHGARVKTGFPGTSDALYPGAAALALKYKGQQPALLVDRTNLTAELIKAVVRSGLYGMPRTRKTEIDDAGLDDIVAYLTRRRD